MSKAARDRYELAFKIWRATFQGWGRLARNPTKLEEAVFAYWRKHGHIEESEQGLMRLTEAGRAALERQDINKEEDVHHEEVRAPAHRG